MFCLAFSLLHSLLTAATVAEVSSWPDEAYQKAWTANLSGTVTVVKADRFVLEDKTGRTRFFHWRGDLQSGDVVKLRCIGVIDTIGDSPAGNSGNNYGADCAVEPA